MLVFGVTIENVNNYFWLPSNHRQLIIYIWIFSIAKVGESSGHYPDCKIILNQACFGLETSSQQAENKLVMSVKNVESNLNHAWFFKGSKCLV